MANFDVQIQALSGTATQTEMDQWMMDGVREITNILPPYLKEYCYSKQTFTSAAANSEAETMITGQLGSVYAGSVECRRIKPMDKHKASSSSSIEFASATDPVYYVEGNKLNILPASSSGVYYVIANPSIDASAVSAIDNFPNEAEHLVVLYAAIKVLQNKMNEMGGISDLSISASAPTIPSDPSISSPGVATIAKPDISGNAPTYTKPTLIGLTSFEDFFNGSEDLNPFGDSDPGAFSTSTPPTLGTASFSTPGISTVTVASFGTAPVYTAPTIGGATEELTATITDGTLGTDADFQDFSDWFEVLGHLIEDEEDTELADSQIKKISTYLSAYQQAMQNKLNEFNDANVEYQATIQEKLKEADLAYQESKEEASLLLQKEIQEYDAKVKEYQAEVNKDVQVYTLKLDRYKYEVGTAIQAWSQQQTQALEKNKLEIQNELNEFNKENEIYKANIQAEILKHQTDAAEAQKEGDLTLQAAIQDYSLELQLYQQELALYQQNVNKEVTQYATNLEQYGIEYQWLQSQQVKLQQDYDKGIQMLVAQGIPQPAQREAR